VGETALMTKHLKQRIVRDVAMIDEIGNIAAECVQKSTEGKTVCKEKDRKTQIKMDG
jgi:hypothetical protein